MAFPVTPLEPTVEIQLDGTWTDVSDYVYCREGDGITITRGQQDEGTQTEPSQCSLSFNNRDGRFSPRNPMSPYYGLIGRNTPLRVSALVGATRLVSDFTNYMRTADSAGLSITGDIDLRADAHLADWAQGGRFIWKYASTGDQRSYVLDSDSSGHLKLFWSTDGTGAGELSATSTVPLRTLSGRQTVRATLDVNNGAAGRTVTFYTGPSVDGPWTQLGDPVVQSGVTSIFDSTSELRGPTLNGAQVYALRVLQGIGGTERANPDFTAQAEGTTSFADAAGNTWSMTGSPSITSRRYRFHGEVSNWPPKWDVSGKDVWVPVTASGILRRLGQGAAVLQSALRRGIPSEAGVVAYWPMEDSDGSTQAASALSGAPAMHIAGAPEMASAERVAGSEPLPVMAGAVFTGAVPSAPTGTIQVRWVMEVPSTGEADFSEMVRVLTTGSATPRWDVFYTTAAGGTFRIVAYDNEGVFAAGGGPVSTHTGVNGGLFQASLELTTSGGNTAWQFSTVNIDTDGSLSQSGTVAGTVGRAASVILNPNAELVGTSFGHVHARSTVAANPYGLENYVRGWVPETPGRRVARLCSEEGIPFVSFGYLGPDSGSAVGTFQGMGPQSPQGLLDLIGEAVTTDLGALIEPRDSFALGYRSRESLYTQTPVLELDYGNLVELEPVEDDQASRNDITVTRADGSSARQVLESGPLSVQAPPDGIGIYDDSVPINIATDAALEQQASWRLHMGTVDEARYPTITLGLERPAFAGDQALTSAALDLEQGDVLTISNPPAWLPPDQIRQIALGFTEVLEPFAWTIEVNCAPASPYDIGVYDQGDPVSRYDTAGSSINEDLTTTETDVTVVTTVGPVWTQAAGDLPFDIVIGGEEMTVTAVSGSSSPQTFTVTRSVNGVVKTHSSGAAVQLADPVYYAL